MRKEIQAAEWFLIIVGLFLLISGSKYLVVFNRIFQVYFFLMTFGMAIWMATRYYKRYNKKNIVVFYLKQKDPLANAIIIKSLQLLIIVSFGVLYYQEFWMYIPILLSFFFFIYQLGKHGQPKLVFHHPHIYLDAIFFENLQPTSFNLHEDGIQINGKDEKKTIPFDTLDETKFKREVEFEENQILDDVLLMEDENEVTRVFMTETQQFAEKIECPIQLVSSILEREE